MKHAQLDNLTQVSLEDLEGFTKRMPNWSGQPFSGKSAMPKKQLSQFVGRADSFFSRIRLDTVLKGVTPVSDLASFISRKGYVDNTNKDIVVPESFTGLWLPYTIELQKALVIAMGINGNVLHLNNALGRIVSDIDNASSVNGIGYQGDRNTPLHTQMLHIGKSFFDATSGHIHRTLGAVVERGHDVNVVQKNVADIIKMDKTNPTTDLMKNIDRSVELVNKILSQAETDTSISKAVTEDMVSVLMMIAREVESYGTLLYRIRQFNESLKDSLVMIKK